MCVSGRAAVRFCQGRCSRASSDFEITNETTGLYPQPSLHVCIYRVIVGGHVEVMEGNVCCPNVHHNDKLASKTSRDV